MFEFKKFPAKIRYEKLNAFNEVILERDVEVFGIFDRGSFEPCDLVVFREIDTVQAPVCLLPAPEFNERFEDYVLVEELNAKD